MIQQLACMLTNISITALAGMASSFLMMLELNSQSPLSYVGEAMPNSVVNGTHKNKNSFLVLVGISMVLRTYTTDRTHHLGLDSHLTRSTYRSIACPHKPNL
eukprot:scaffold34604_cov88-Skeletonema_dohrnii-CCMP3373.AAC.1